MRHRKMVASAAKNLVFSLGLIPLLAAAQTGYSVLQLDGPATALNNLGQVAGQYGMWDFYISGPNGQGKTFFPGWDGPKFGAINDKGWAVGGASVPFPGGAVSYRPDQGVYSLHQPGWTYSGATGINQAGRVVGVYSTDQSAMAPTILQGFASDIDGGHLQELGFLPYAINASGQIAGKQGDKLVLADALGNVKDLGALPPLTPVPPLPSMTWSERAQSSATGISDSGQVVGNFYDGEFQYPYSYFSVARAFVTGANGEGMRELGMLAIPADALAHSSLASDINNAGQIVGAFSYLSSAKRAISHAFIADADDASMVDLNDLVSLGNGDYLVDAIDINDRGQILVRSSLGESYLLSPVPEAGSLAMAGMGGLMVLAVARARRRGPRHES